MPAGTGFARAAASDSGVSPEAFFSRGCSMIPAPSGSTAPGRGPPCGAPCGPTGVAPSCCAAARGASPPTIAGSSAKRTTSRRAPAGMRAGLYGRRTVRWARRYAGRSVRYEGRIYRPPSEADSLILQATIGCSYNRCSYCAMYIDKRFRPRPLDELREDMALASAYYGAGAVRRVFLADGDALILRTARLLEILADLRAAFPDLQRVSTYASPQALLAKSVAELAELKAAGLTLHYVGPES